MKIKKISEDRIIFDNGAVLTSEHSQCCCESHYLDFSNLLSYNLDVTTGETINIFEREFDFSSGVQFEKVEGVGILLFDKLGNKYLCNGYGSNNGYYGTDITLLYYDRENSFRYSYDVSECQDIDWC